MILGLTPNADGLMPAQDADTLAAFGSWLKSRFGEPLATVEDSTGNLVVTTEEKKTIHDIVLQENVEKGQRVRSFRLEALQGEQWNLLFGGSSIGYKYIHTLPEGFTSEKIRLVIDRWIGKETYLKMAVY